MINPRYNLSYKILYKMKTDPQSTDTPLLHGHKEVRDECHVSQTSQESVGECHHQQVDLQGPSREEAASESEDPAQENNVLVTHQRHKDIGGNGLAHCSRDAECQIDIMELTEIKAQVI